MTLIPLTLEENYQQGGETESQKQARLYNELNSKPQPKYTDSEVWDEVRQEYVPSWKFNTIKPKEDTPKGITDNIPPKGMYYNSSGFLDLLPEPITRPKEIPITYPYQYIPDELKSNKINLQPTTTKVPEFARLNIKPEVKRQYKEENGKYYMRFFDKKADKEEWRPITKESYRLGQKEADSGIRFEYEDGGLIKLEL